MADASGFVEPKNEQGSRRFAGLPRRRAAVILVLMAALVALGLWSPGGQALDRPATSDNDVALYRAVVERVKHGDPYETAAVAEQRARYYPLKPFVVVRPPALAIGLALLPDEEAGSLLLALLAAAVVGAWALRLQSVRTGPAWLAGTALVLFTGVGVTMAGGGASLFHEAWAGLLIALSLALRTDKRFVAAVLIGLLAAVIRELAMPYLAVMALLALVERRRLEALGFAAALGVALGLLALHAHAVLSLVTPGDLTSASWVQLGGWAFVLKTARWNLLAVLAGSWLAAIILPLSLIGAAGWKNATGSRLTVVLVGYTLGFMAIGRPENDYWGLLIAPLTAVGLCLAPRALTDLVRGRLGEVRDRPGDGAHGAEPVTAGPS